MNTVGLECSSCHGPNPGVGPTHNENNVTGGADYASRTLSDIRQEVDIAFDTFNPNGAYDQAKGSRSGNGDGTCSSLYCHADDTTVQGNGSQFPAASQGSKTQPMWNRTDALLGPGLGDGACGTCHGATAAAPPGSFAHGTHAGSAAGYSFTCNICHVNTTADGSTIASYTYHVNKEADVAFDALDNRLDGGSAYGGTVTVGDAAADAGDSCSATYCHSPGNDAAAPFGQAPAQVLEWNGTSDCFSCHGVYDIVTPANNTPMPSYTDRLDIDGVPKGNKHQKHVKTNGFGCEVCHYPTTTDGSTIANRANHVDFAYTVDDDPANDPHLGDLAYSAGTCSTTNCHGGNSYAAPGDELDWSRDVVASGAITCDYCHAMVDGAKAGVTDVNNFSFGDWIQTKINDVPTTGEFTASGHGGKGIACTDCHDSLNTEH
ncbi:MAG: CxxxxCH/CxxCH domain-containing protein, partial [Gemmatimonadales bacterium]|nr:CxxxxCH/CxxCH domain-containing protein [Gemmatimonadales bacterium]